MNTLGKILMVIGVLAVTAISAAYAAEDNTVLRPGDVLQVVIPGEENFNEPMQIDVDGAVLLPEVGSIIVAGMPLDVARATVLERLETVYRDLSRFELRLKERRLLIQVLGFIKAPGEINLAASANIQTAIIAAGGLRQGAQLDRMQLRRGGSIQVFDYKRYLDTGDLAALPQLEPKDVIFVPASPLLGNVQIDLDAKTLASSGDAGENGSAIKVFGEVNKPGSFAFKPGQSVVDLVMRAGGVTRYASVEKIRVMIDGTPNLFDLKQFLDTGRTDLMPELKAGATIYVPISTEEIKAGIRTIYVMGEVAKPGAYEMTEGASFFDVLANSGGPTRYAETRRLRIIRADGQVVPFDLASYTEGRAKQAVPHVRPGDAIFVPEKLDQLEKSWLKVAPDQAIKVMGQVIRPGRYEWSDEMSLLDLLAHAGGPTRDADTSHVQILSVGENGAEPRTFDLENFLKKGGRLDSLPVLKAGDTILLPELPRDPNSNKAQWVRQSSDNSIYVMGAVETPGRYAFNATLNFLDILAAADGPRSTADIQNIRISHRDGAGARVTRLNLALYFETGDETLLPRVNPGDVIYVPSRDRDWTEIDRKQTVRVLGSVGNPGRYRFDDGMSILDLLAEAGGPTSDAWQEKIVVVNLVSGDDPKASSFDLVGFAQSGNFAKLPVVRAGDTIYVPTTAQSPWRIFMTGVRDTVSVLSIFAILGGL